jgi:cell division protease FtsH
VHKVTIIPRGQALGVTHYLPEEKFIRSREYCEAQLTHILGGRAAESIIYNKLTTGAANDIRRASDIARAMVCDWGMSEKMGPLAFGKKQEEIFLGREIAQHRDYSERTAQEIDAEIKKIIVSAEKRAKNLLQENIDKLHLLAKALLEYEILDGANIDDILSGKFVGPKKHSRRKPRRSSGPRRPYRGKQTQPRNARTQNQPQKKFSIDPKSKPKEKPSQGQTKRPDSRPDQHRS